MNTSLETALYQAGALTFEELGLTATNKELTENQAQAALTAVACVRFSGIICGQLRVVLYGDVLPEIASNMLGEMDLPPDGVRRDALGELANIICGNVLPLMTNPKAVFHLGAPCLAGTLICHNDNGEQPITRVSIGLEGGRADLMLLLQGCQKQEAGK